MIKGSTMFEDEVLLTFLDASANRALERVKSDQLLTVEEAMPLLLKAQFNHIAHLDQSIAAIDSRFAAIDSRFAAIDSRFAAIESRLDVIDATMITRSEFQEKFEKIQEKFEKIDDKFERVFHRMNVQIAWMVGTILTSSGVIFGLNHLLS